MVDPAEPVLLEQLSCHLILSNARLAAPVQDDVPSPDGGDVATVALTITKAQRRALAERDHGCAIPGCSTAAHWCDGHAVRWWKDAEPSTGETASTNETASIDELVLLCERHHTQVHLGIWGLVVQADGVWARPPDWLDPQHRLVRNTYFQLQEGDREVSRAAAELDGERLAVEPGDTADAHLKPRRQPIERPVRAPAKRRRGGMSRR